MVSPKHIPYWILSLILASAFAVLVLGFHFSNETREVPVEQNRASLSEFTTLFLKEVESLEKLYEDRLINIRHLAGRELSSRSVLEVCRDIVGIEQATIFEGKKPPEYLDLREEKDSEALPLPRRMGDRSRGTGILIDLEKFERSSWMASYQWISQPGHPPHFLSKVESGGFLLLRIDQEAIAGAADEWLKEWLPDNFSLVEHADISASLWSPAGEVIAASGEFSEDQASDFVLPVASLFGTWKIFSRGKTETVTSYRWPIMVGASALAVILVGAGLFGFSQQTRAVRLAEQRVSFVNRVSHELRTPMMNILLNVDLLSDPEYGDEEKRRKRLGLIGEESKRLSRLLENVLSFSRREKDKGEDRPAQTFRLESCQVDHLLDSVISQYTSSLQRRGIALLREDSEEKLFIFVDPDAFSQILGNLISNGEKYAAEGGRIDILTRPSEDGSEVEIAVADYGPGIPKSDGAKIFRPFARLNEATSEGVSGTGLGLAIARDLAEAMGGKLELDPNWTDGARFVLRFPQAADNIVQMAG